MAWKAIIDWPSGTSTLNVNINNAVETIVLASDPGTAMSAADFWVRIGYEQIYVVSRATVTLTCTGGRGANGTTAAAHFAGDEVVQDFFAAHITELRDAVDSVSSSPGVFDTFITVGGGYGDTGCTIATDGDIQTNGTLTVDSTSTLTGIVTLGAASMVTPATFAFAAAATALTLGAATGTCTIANTTLAAKAGTFSTTLAVTGVVTATAASNAINIGSSCTMTIPPAIGGTTPNTIKGTTFEATGATFTLPATYTFGDAGCTSLTLGTGATTARIGAATGTFTVNNATLAAKAITVTNTSDSAIEFLNFKTTFATAGHQKSMTWRDASGNVVSQIDTRYSAPTVSIVFGHLYNSGVQTGDIFALSGAGIATLTGYLTTTGGVHVGGTSDPGADNLIVDGTGHFVGALDTDSTLTVDGASTLTGVVTLGGANMVLPATFTFGSATCTTLNLGTAGATTVGIGAATGTCTVNNTTLAAKAVTCSTTLAVTGASTLTGVVTATAAANVINIGSSCTMTIPPVIGGTTPNVITGSTITATTAFQNSATGILTLGQSGVVRGQPIIYHGADGTTAGYIKIYSRNGTAHYIWVEDDMTLKISSAIPVLNADGSVVGAQT